MKRVLFGSLILLPVLALAHPGHDEQVPAAQPSHYLLEPIHLATWLLAGLAIVGLAMAVRRRRPAVR